MKKTKNQYRGLLMTKMKTKKSRNIFRWFFLKKKKKRKKKNKNCKKAN